MLPIMKPGVAVEISARLRQLGDPEKAPFLQGFLKTGPVAKWEVIPLHRTGTAGRG